MSLQMTVPAASTSLPSPPSDEEKYWYMGRQHRWLLLLQALAFLLIAYSVMRFSISDSRLLLFLVPMSLYCITLCVSLTSSTRRKRTDLFDHDLRVSEWTPVDYPSVDVFLPTAGEPLDVLRNTYRYVAALDWPGDLAIWVLDDGARASVAELAAEFQFNYRSRPDRGHLKKAGNLRYGYDHSEADYIAIFDADFVPRSDYLHELIPYFEDDWVGIVQTPQFFDTAPDMHWLQRCAGATQELFYRWVQPSRDAAGAAICVGSCAIYRRSALARSGGFAQIGHSEDVHTGVNLLKIGFQVRYVPILLAKGLCPDNLLGFLNQQYRWCTGSMSLLRDKTFHASAAISLRQRLCFWAGFLYYISTAVNAFLAPVPSLVMIYLLPRWVYPINSIWLVGALLLWILVVPSLFRSHWRITVLRVQMIYSFAHAMAILHILTGRTREWIATGSAAGPATTRRTPLAVTISRVMKTYVALALGLIWVGLVRGVLAYGWHRFWAMVFFACLATYILAPILTLSTKPKSSVAPEPDPEPATVPVAVPTQRSLPSRKQIWTPQAAGPRRWRPDIQGLRAIAVLLVVLYHADVPGITGGYVGVDVFFVISGFLITGQLWREVQETGRISLRNFYGGRMRRLLPPAAVVVVITVVAARIWGSIFQVESVAKDAIFTAIYGLNYRLAAEGVNYQNAGGPPSPLQHMWSLGVEEQFYIVWPLLIMACLAIRSRRRGVLLFAVVTILTEISIVASIALTESNPPYAYFSIHTRAWELGLGAMLALVADRLAALPRRIVIPASWLGLALVVGSGLWFNNATPFPGSAALVPTLGATLVLAAGCRFTRGSAESLLARPMMQGIGKVSYSWYLWHWPILIMVPIMAGEKFGWVLKTELAVLSLWIAVLSLFLLENPTQRSRFHRPRWLAGGAVITVVTVNAAIAVVLTVPSLMGSGKAIPLRLGKPDTAHVQQVLIAGLSVMKVPANLVPTVQNAVNDAPISSSNGCHADYLKVTQGACVFGDPAGTHTVVLTGDSHGQQWLPALDAAAKLRHWRVVSWTKAACPVADITVHNEQLGREFTECNRWRAITHDRIAALKPDLVMVSQSDTVPGKQLSDTAWADATVRSLNKIRAHNIPVGYFLDTPYPNQIVPDCVANHLTNVGACNFDRKAAYLYPSRHEVMATTLKAAKISAVEPLNWFCTPTKCPVIIGNILIYRDASHMSARYGRWLAPVVAPLFTSLPT